MTTSDLVKEMCQKQGISIAALAKNLGQTRQNFYKKLQRDTLTLTELKQIAEVLDANFEQLFRMPDGTKFSLKSENKKRTVLPLVGSAFEPGGAKEAIERIQDKELSEIAQAELYYFSAQAENCVKIVENYLSSDKIICCGGSWMVKGDLVKAGEFDKIRELTAEACKLVASIRG